MIRDKLHAKEHVGLALNGTSVASAVEKASETFKANGVVKFELFDKDGNLKETHSLNLVVDVGFAFITGRMVGVTPAVMSHMAIGSGVANPAHGDTVLGAELGRVLLTSTDRVTTTVTNDAVQFIATADPGIGSGAVTEAGIFNAANGGDMLARTTFPVINKGVDDSLTITWKVTLS